ncbi:MAG: hypothetical protein ACTSO7_13665 [Candidatus Heimdallarchaeota archaeon]
MQGTRIILKWFFVGIMICLVNTSVINVIINHNIISNDKEQEELTKAFIATEKPENENFSTNIINYPPYLQRFRGRMPINGVQASKDFSQIYFGHITYGFGCYYPENDSIRTLSFEEPISDITDENTITDIALDENQSKLYVGAWTGLIIVDLTDWSYEQRNFSDGYFIIEIRSMHFDEQDQMLFISTDNGLRIFFTSNQTFFDTAKLPSSIQTSGIKDIAYNYKTDELYIAKYSELLLYNFTAKTLTTIYEPSYFILSVDSDFENNLIFLGGNGLVIVNLTNYQEIAQYGAHPNPMYYYDTYNLIYEPRFGGMVFGSIDWDKGAFVANITTETISYLNKSTGLFHDFVSSFEPFTDNSTGIPKDYMLIACKGGFNYYDYKTNVITKSLLLDKDIPSNQASYLSHNSELNHLYIGCNDDYLSVIDLNTTTNIANYDYTTGLPNIFIGYSHFHSENNTLFINTGMGLILFNLTSNETIRIITTADGLLDNNIQDMLLVEDLDCLFIATINGFNILDLETFEISQYFSGLYCFSLTFDKEKQTLYIGTDGYLKILDLSSMTFLSVTLPDTSLCFDIQLYNEKQIAFLATHDGLYILDLDNFNFIGHYTRENSPLNNNLLYKGIHFDEQTGNLFISNIDITVFNFEHNFWLNLNDANLVDEGLFEINTDSIIYTNNKLYLGTFSYGLFIIDHRDEDLDEIFDCYEVWLFGTDPTMNDTDYDGYTDGVELWAGTDPLDPNSVPIQPSPNPNNLRYLWFLTVLSIPVVIIIVFVIRRKQKK